jgi:hypothetical protein
MEKALAQRLRSVFIHLTLSRQDGVRSVFLFERLRYGWVKCDSEAAMLSNVRLKIETGPTHS